jgi:hypothetical protein
MSQKYKMLIKHPPSLPRVREKIKPNFRWVDWQPAGYTDDLGIIADRNQWVEEVVGGYYSVIDAQDYLPMREWCEQNFKHGDWRTDFAGGLVYIILQNEKDVAWFMLRWS